jgi:hypothetical protein
VTLSVDRTRALRTRSELINLVDAIEDASPSEAETDSLEWKSHWDLASAETRFETARHILGFGNRSLTLAGRDFEGCAYFLAGIEPGNLIGTSVVDPAELDDQLSRYILPGAPRWTPHYVSIDSKDVLILLIEAPQPGDPICTLQKGFN